MRKRVFGWILALAIGGCITTGHDVRIETLQSQPNGEAWLVVSQGTTFGDATGTRERAAHDVLLYCAAGASQPCRVVDFHAPFRARH